ncbi:MAG: PHP domain-containing protein [Polyangiaceae bacterium]|nr:PHP domain-containing protein [Polyangiaceae bacterium]
MTRLERLRESSRGVAVSACGVAAVALLMARCSDSGDRGGGAAAGGAGGTEGGACPTEESRFAAGDAVGHVDPYGARAAGQARAGRLTSEAMIVQPAHGRQRIRVGDYVLANDRIALAVEDAGLSDGYARFGGEVLSIDRVGEDGRPAGESRYLETLMALSIEMVNVERVSVIADGSDGGAAIVRAEGRLEPIPFLNGALAALFPRRYGLRAAYDYVLEPGAEHVLVRVGILNPGSEPVAFAVGGVSDEMHGFFHYSQNQLVTAHRGFAKASKPVPFAGFVSGEWNFAWTKPGGVPLAPQIEISGFQYFTGPGFEVPACAEHWVDHVRLVAGGPEYDGLREAVRRAEGEPAWRAISGTVRTAAGAAAPGAWVHAEGVDGTYLTRTRADASGAYTLHVPPAEAARLHAYLPGYPVGAGVEVPAASDDADLALPAAGTVHVVARAADGVTPLPVRVQVIPAAAVEGPPDAWGMPTEANDRLHVDYAVTGEATLAVPPGEHRVVVSRGSEWELHDETVTVTAGAVAEIAATLERSVDTTGVMCADFHVHSHFSADSNDSVLQKVKSAIADGLDIPVSSEHEWVIDFQPTIESLGLEAWAYGMPSEELTTFAWGHFGVVPLLPRPDAVNNGAVEWIGTEPPAMFAAVQSLPEDPVFVINHPSGGGFGAYFSAAGLDRETGTGDASLWSTDFDAIEVFNDSDFEANRDKSVRDWFALLGHGHTFWAVGSSDSHHLRSSPVGYPRTCVDVGTDDPRELTHTRVRDALAAGRATVSGGLYLTVEGPGGAGPGTFVTSRPGTADFTVTVAAPSWLDATTLEVIVDGETQATVPLQPLGAGTGKRWMNVVSVALDPTRARNWVVFHARGDGDLSPVHPGRRVFAVSNPVFFGT